MIYDAAHCFGVNYLGSSIFNYGDVSTCSFHATKLFHTAEGGAMFATDAALQHQLYYSHNFGHNGYLNFFGLGINGKASELQAAMGLAVLPHIEEIISARKEVVTLYNNQLNFSVIQKLKIRENTEWNFSYYPVIFENEEMLLEVQKKLNEADIFPRRYFYPSLNTINYVQGQSVPISKSIASKIFVCRFMLVCNRMK